MSARRVAGSEDRRRRRAGGDPARFVLGVAGAGDRPAGSSPAQRTVATIAGVAAATVLLVFAAAGRAPAAEPLSLEAAVRLAREGNPMIRQAESERQAARAARREAWLYRLPSVDAREIAVRTDSPADVFGLQLMQERFSFPAFMQNDPNKPEDFDNYTTEVEVRMPLFTGGSLHYGIKAAGKMAEAAEAVRDHTMRAVDLGVTQAYLGALLAGRFRELAETAHATTARHVEQAEAFFDAGMLVESDLLHARVQLAKMEENRIRAANGERLARAGLGRVLGLDETREFTLADAPAAELPLPSTQDEALALATARRADLHAVDRKVEAARAAVGRARGEYFPQIGVAAKWAWNDDQAFGTHGDSRTLAAMAEWKLWNWGQTQARVSRAKHEANAAAEARRGYRQQVEFEVRQAWQGVEEARARLTANTGAVAAAERALAIIDERFGQGIARMTDLLDAETQAHEARVREAQARFDLQTAARNLLFTIGHEPVPEVTR